MDVKILHFSWGRWKSLLSMLLIIVALLIVCVMWFWEPCAPKRPFKPDDLLIDQSVIPTAWTDVWGPDTEFYNNRCRTAYTSIRFGMAERELPLQATHEIFRNENIGSARRYFENSRIPLTFPEQPTEWTYQGTVADQSYFGCADDSSSNSLLSCQWAGLYEEFIVVFWVRMTPGEVNFEDIEKAVKAIDTRMALYLNESSTSTPSTE